VVILKVIVTDQKMIVDAVLDSGCE